MVTGFLEFRRQTLSTNWSFSSKAHERDGRMRLEQHSSECPSPMALIPAMRMGTVLFLKSAMSAPRFAGDVVPSRSMDLTPAWLSRSCRVWLK